MPLILCYLLSVLSIKAHNVLLFHSHRNGTIKCYIIVDFILPGVDILYWYDLSHQFKLMGRLEEIIRHRPDTQTSNNIKWGNCLLSLIWLSSAQLLSRANDASRILTTFPNLSNPKSDSILAWMQRNGTLQLSKTFCTDIPLFLIGQNEPLNSPVRRHLKTPRLMTALFGEQIRIS